MCLTVIHLLMILVVNNLLFDLTLYSCFDIMLEQEFFLKGLFILIYFTSDLHFYHDKIICHCNRPFLDSVMMNEKLIQNWNSVVKPDDDVFILGDVTMKGPSMAFDVLCRLTGKKYLVRGNHDRFLEKDTWHDYDYVFEWVKDYFELEYLNHYFILFHYPIAEWNGKHRGSVHLHGHQHNFEVYNYQQKHLGIRRYDVGVDANHFMPVSADSILSFFNN